MSNSKQYNFPSSCTCRREAFSTVPSAFRLRSRTRIRFYRIHRSRRTRSINNTGAPGVPRTRNRTPWTAWGSRMAPQHRHNQIEGGFPGGGGGGLRAPSALPGKLRGDNRREVRGARRSAGCLSRHHGCLLAEGDRAGEEHLVEALAGRHHGQADVRHLEMHERCICMQAGHRRVGCSLQYAWGCRLVPRTTRKTTRVARY